MKELLIALAIAHGADVTTTLQARAAGGVEGHPLLRLPPPAFVAVSAGVTTAQLVALAKLEKSKPRLARTLGLVSLGVECAAVGNNIRVRIDIKAR